MTGGGKAARIFGKLECVIFHVSGFRLSVECSVCEAMHRALQVSERKYHHSRGWLADLSGGTDAERFNNARKIADDARMEYEVARLDFEQHIAAFHTPAWHKDFPYK